MKVPTRPFDDQNPGTSGLRKKLARFRTPHYLENFTQSVFDCLSGFEGKTLILGGDGRLHTEPACRTIVRMAAANGVGRVIIGQNGLLSTPAASHLVRISGAFGAFILTASHNPAGESGDFGIKFNDHTGGPAQPSLTDAIYRRSLAIDRYRIGSDSAPDFALCGRFSLDGMEIDVIDPIAPYCELMERIFDFDAIKDLFATNFTFRFDAMSAVTGPYGRALFVDRLGLDPERLLNAEPHPTFCGKHPDPNRIHAADLIAEAMGEREGENGADLSAACDGDGDRNLIVGRGQFVGPGDSLAILAAHAHLVPAYASGLKGIARSMATSRAVDSVAESLGIELFETPTGWKFFADLLERGKISLCGEESFGTGSDHVREKDGLWAILFWLNILAKHTANSAAKTASVSGILQDHWRTYGRHDFERHDFESLPQEQGEAVMERIRAKLPQPSDDIAHADEFHYEDLDGNIARNQGLRIFYENGSRLVFRLSGTDSSGTTLRVYLESYCPPQKSAAKADFQKLVAEYMRIGEIESLTGRTRPDIIT